MIIQPRFKLRHTQIVAVLLYLSFRIQAQTPCWAWLITTLLDLGFLVSHSKSHSKLRVYFSSAKLESFYHCRSNLEMSKLFKVEILDQMYIPILKEKISSSLSSLKHIFPLFFANWWVKPHMKLILILDVDLNID